MERVVEWARKPCPQGSILCETFPGMDHHQHPYPLWSLQFPDGTGESCWKQTSWLSSECNQTRGFQLLPGCPPIKAVPSTPAPSPILQGISPALGM